MHRGIKPGGDHRVDEPDKSCLEELNQEGTAGLTSLINHAWIARDKLLKFVSINMRL